MQDKEQRGWEGLRVHLDVRQLHVHVGCAPELAKHLPGRLRSIRCAQPARRLCAPPPPPPAASQAQQSRRRREAVGERQADG